MTDPDNNKTAEQRFTEAYERMMHRVREHALPDLQQRVDAARDKAVELGELTADEAEKIGGWLRRDIHDAAEFIASTSSELAQWLRFDLDLIEDRLRDMLEATVDRTRSEIEAIADRARQFDEIHTGEVVAPGTLACVDCGQELNLHGTSHVPPCPKCHGSRFKRAAA